MADAPAFDVAPQEPNENNYLAVYQPGPNMPPALTLTFLCMMILNLQASPNTYFNSVNEGVVRRDETVPTNPGGKWGLARALTDPDRGAAFAAFLDTSVRGWRADARRSGRVINMQGCVSGRATKCLLCLGDGEPQVFTGIIAFVLDRCCPRPLLPPSAACACEEDDCDGLPALPHAGDRRDEYTICPPRRVREREGIEFRRQKKLKEQSNAAFAQPLHSSLKPSPCSVSAEHASMKVA